MTATVLKLTGGGNYSGQTTISAGTIQCGTGNALGSSLTISFGSASTEVDLDGEFVSVGR